MRTELAKLVGQRRKFKGTFVRFGTKSGWKGKPVSTLLLENVIDVKTGKTVADHLWFTLTKGFDAIQLVQGDAVSFFGRVTKYVKGYKGRREDCEKPLEVDFRLSFPTKLAKVASTPTESL